DRRLAPAGESTPRRGGGRVHGARRSWCGMLMERARYTLDQKERRELYTEATQIIHDEKPSLELFQEVVVYGTSKRVSFKVRPDYRLIVAEMAVSR
ncbi:MAG: hypothetical protein AAB418_07335, partial [candidate division NC10 bacterium]